MLHPILSTAFSRPDLIVDHLAGYSALIKQETSEAVRSVVMRIVAGAVAFVSATIALVLVGVAVMLGFVHDEFNWALVIVPGVALIVAAASLAYAIRSNTVHGFTELKAQCAADMQALRLAGGAEHV
ncbi:MAG: hypothetical protein ABIW85_01815 [Variovorax sp.]